MPKLYYSVLTSYGSQAFARAMASRQPLNITTFAVGDGNGRAVQPDSQRTSLVREVYRANVSAISLDPRNPRQVIFELTIPENVGGFWIREMGIFDNQNRLVAYANCPDSFKPQLESGSGKVQVLRMILLVSSSDAVTLTVDDSVIFAKRGELTPQTITATSQNSVDQTGHSHAIDHASTSRKGVVQLTNDTGLDSESLAFSAKGAKNLAQQIAQNRLNTTNLANQKVDKTAISDSVSSTSQTSVASSKAVKTAYDQANTKVPINGDCEMKGTKTFYYQILIKVGGIHEDKYARFGQNDVDSFIENPYSGKCLQLRNNGRLQYDGLDVFVKGLQNPSWSDVENKPTTLTEYGITDFKVEELSNENLNEVMTAGIYGQPSNNNALINRNYPEQQAGTLLVTNSAYGVQQEYTTYASHRKYVRGKNGRDWQAWERVDGKDKVDLSGNYARLTANNDDFAGWEVNRRGSRGSWTSRAEALPDKRWKFWAADYNVFLPAKSGTAMLDSDFEYRKIGNFKIHKFPDGTMFQTYSYTVNDLIDWSRKEFNWAVAFVETPEIFTKITTSYSGSHDCGVNVLSSSNNAKVYYHFYEHGNTNQGLCRVQFLAIGRWK